MLVATRIGGAIESIYSFRYSPHFNLVGIQYTLGQWVRAKKVQDERILALETPGLGPSVFPYVQLTYGRDVSLI